MMIRFHLLDILFEGIDIFENLETLNASLLERLL